MESFVDFVQMLVGDVGVDLGGSNVGVAKERLHTTEVGTVFQKVGRKRVADDVRRDFTGNASFCCIFFNQTLDRAWSEPPARGRLFFTPQVAAHLYKQRVVYVAAFIKIVFDTALSSRGEEYYPHLFAFATDREFVTG